MGRESRLQVVRLNMPRAEYYNPPHGRRLPVIGLTKADELTDITGDFAVRNLLVLNITPDNLAVHLAVHFIIRRQ